MLSENGYSNNLLQPPKKDIGCKNPMSFSMFLLEVQQSQETFCFK